MLLANELESIALSDGTTQALGPAARDAFAIDLCLLGNGERPQFLQLLPQDVCSQADREHTLELPRTLTQGVSLLPFTHPRPVCQQLASNLSCSQHSELSIALQYHLSPPASQTSPSAPLSRLPSAVLVLSSRAQAILLQARDRGRSHPHGTHRTHQWRD
jgi:hypothetical protein